MKKTSIEELSKLIRTQGGDELEKAAAVAVVASLLASNLSQQQASKSDWASRSGLREGLDKSKLRNL